MKRTISFITLGALALALTASLALSQGSTPAAAPATTPAKAAPTAKAEAPAKATMKTAKPKVEMVDINSASKEDLMKLNGVTDEIAEKIIAGRPYKSKAQLVSKGVVTKGGYTKIRGHVVAKKAS